MGTPCGQARWLPPFGDCGSVGNPSSGNGGQDGRAATQEPTRRLKRMTQTPGWQPDETASLYCPRDKEGRGTLKPAWVASLSSSPLRKQRATQLWCSFQGRAYPLPSPCGQCDSANGRLLRSVACVLSVSCPVDIAYCCQMVGNPSLRRLVVGILTSVRPPCRCSGTFGSLHQKPRVGGDNWWCTSRRPRWMAIAGPEGRHYWGEGGEREGRVLLRLPPTIVCTSFRQVPNILANLGHCTRRLVLYIQTGCNSWILRRCGVSVACCCGSGIPPSSALRRLSKSFSF